MHTYAYGLVVMVLAVSLLAAPRLSHGKGREKGGGLRLPEVGEGHSPAVSHEGGRDREPGVSHPSTTSEPHPPAFLPEEQQRIGAFFHGASSGLPPGLAKRGGQLPPGLQQHVQRHGLLPPGLQARVQPLPAPLEQQLPRLPEGWGRVILGPHVLLLDRQTGQILDILENIMPARSSEGNPTCAARRRRPGLERGVGCRREPRMPA